MDVGDSFRNYYLAFFGYHESKCTEDNDAIQKYLSTGRKWEITSAKATIFLCKTVPTAKDIHKLGTLVCVSVLLLFFINIQCAPLQSNITCFRVKQLQYGYI